MRKGTSMLGWLLAVAACSGTGAAAAASPAEREPAGRTSVVATAVTGADRTPGGLSNGGAPDAGCGFTHRGDQSRSLDLAVSGLHREDAPAGLAWMAPPFTSLLDGYEYRAFPASEGARGAVWVDTGGLTPTVALAASRSRPDHAFEVVARYRFPLPDGHVYYWYGPIAGTEPTAPGRAGCGATFGPPDTTLAFEEDGAR